MSRIPCAILMLLSGCGEATAVRYIELDSCTDLTVRGEFSLNLYSTGPVRLEMRGVKQSIDAVAVQLRAGRVVIISDAVRPFDVDVYCPDLHRLELLGAVAARQPPGEAVQGETNAAYEKIAVYGQSRFAAEQMSTQNLDLRGSAKAQIAIDQLVVESLVLLMSGDSTVVVSGTAGSLVADLSGKATLSAAALRVQSLKLKARGDSRAAVFATAHLTAELHDSTRLTYRGTPDLHIQQHDRGLIERD